MVVVLQRKNHLNSGSFRTLRKDFFFLNHYPEVCSQDAAAVAKNALKVDESPLLQLS